MSNATAAYAILCDLIRREDNNKLIAVGIYGSELNVGAFPAVLNLSILVRVVFPSAGPHSLKFRVSTNEIKHDFGIDIEAKIKGHDLIPLAFQPLIFQSPSKIDVMVEYKVNKWKNILSVPVLLNQSQL
ncbi:hypothetical protein [Cypionkella sp. TWP1-2-1b2]|uniref:hypothetical protein n=1 Tax=Cypionkella sp. TWP1-2-1b2 TaxID=2804675 RepID=UPI003CF46EFB